MMKAILIEAYGDTDVLKEGRVERPTIESNQVLVEIKAFAINPVDWKIRRGYFQQMMPFPMPLVLGMDLAGVVSEVGTAVQGFQKGDRVFGSPNVVGSGTYQEFAAVNEDILAIIPDEITFEEAASLPVAALTSWSAVESMNITAKDTVLVQAGAGAVGGLAVQFAKHKGAKVIATTSTKNIEVVKAFGADEVLDYTVTPFEAAVNNVDVVIDPLGGEAQEKSFTVLKKQGRLASIAVPPNMDLAQQYEVDAQYIRLITDNATKQLEKIAQLVVDGEIKTSIAEVLPFTAENVQKAHAISETGHAKGKYIIQF